MKYMFLLLGSIASLGTVSAANAETIENALSKCSEQSNSLQRLVCYDRVVKDIEQYSGLEGSVTRAPAMPKATADSPQSSAPATSLQRPPQKQAQQGSTRFGMEHTEKSNTEADTMTAVISSLSTTVFDKYVLTLDNGTVWQQTDSQIIRLKPDQQITIERGLLGAFYLAPAGLNKRMKVKRVE